MRSEPVVVLVVEDEPAHREAIRRTLEATGAGFEARTAETLGEYLEMAAATPPDIALVDINLPDGRALEVLTSPAEAGPFPVLVMTSYGNEQTAVEALKSGALDYLVKSPEAFAAMPRIVERSLREWKLLQVRKRAEEDREATIELLRLCNKAAGTKELMCDLTRFFRNLSGCEAVGVRLREGDDFPYYETSGFPEEFLLLENSLCETDAEGKIACDSDGNPVLECMCGNILLGRFNPALHFFTPTGSFWTNSTSGLLAATTEAERQARTRNRCNGEGYESVALIPLRLQGETFGLFQLNSKRKGRFTAERINLFENLVSHIAITLAKLRTDEALEESNQFSRQVINGADEGVIVYGLDLRYQVWNPYMERLTGLPADKVLGRQSFEVFLFLQEPDFIESMDKIIATQKSVNAEFPFNSVHNGRSGWVSVTRAPLRNSKGETIGVIGTMRDITERKRSEEKIEHLNHVLRAIRTVDQLILHEKDPDNLAEKTCRLLVDHRRFRGAAIILTDESGGYHAHSAADGGLSFTPLEENLRQGILPACCLRAEKGDGILNVTQRAVFCTGCPIYCGSSGGDAGCIRLLHGDTVYGYLLVEVERDQRIDMEEESLLREMANDVAFALHNIKQAKAMQQVLGERDRFQAELHQAQKMEAIGRLAGGVAHDFNNILTAIIGFSQVILDKLPSDSPVRHFVEMIFSSAEKAAGLTRSLLAFSRKQKINPVPTDMNEVIANIAKLLSRLMGEDIELRMELHPAPLVALADSGQIEQVLMNLATNARDAMPDGGRFTIMTERVFLDREFINIYGWGKPGDYICILVKDSGCGIPKEAQEEIFEPFFTTKEIGKGTGLGLSIVHGIVKQHEGYIGLESSPDSGTIFRIYLPHLPDGEEKVEIKPARILSTGNEKILLVEDDSQILELARIVLEDCGYTVVTASTPVEACRILEGGNVGIDLLISDVVMPMMNGKELQARIERYMPDIRTLFMSGYTADIIADRGVIEQGINFLHKPFSASSLIEKVRMVLDG